MTLTNPMPSDRAERAFARNADEPLGLRHLLTPVVLWFALLIALAPAEAQSQGYQLSANPLNGPRALSASGELIVLTPAAGGLQQEVVDFTFDPADPQAPAGFIATGSAVEADVGVFNEWTPLAAGVGEFDGSGEAEYAYGWVGADGNVRVRVVDTDAGAPTTIASEIAHPHGPGSRPSMRVLAGEFDGDPGQELAFVHTMDTKQIHWVKYDVAADLSLSELSSGMQENGSNGFGCSSTAQNLFDALLLDVDGDGLDNIVLGRIEEDCLQNQLLNRVWIHTVEHGPTSFHWFTTCSGVATCPNRPSDMKIAAGYFSGSQNPIEIAYHFPTGAWIGQDWMPSFVGRTSWNGAGFSEINQEKQLAACQELDCSDRRFAIAAADLNGDGQDEIVLARGPRAELYELNDNGGGLPSSFSISSLPNVHAQLSTSGGHFALGSGRLAVSDFNQLHSTTVGGEIAIVETNGSTQSIRFFTAQKSGSVWSLTAPAAPNDRIDLPGLGARDLVILAQGDLDRDQIFLGSPEVQEVFDVPQPIVVLNSPPIHFDVTDDGSEVLDVSECFPIGASCTHLAAYTQSGSTTQIATTTVGASWAVGAEVTAFGGYEGGIFGGSVEATLTSEYGQDFSNSGSTGQTVTVSTTTQGSRDGRVYMTIADYRVIEYPIYLARDLATPISHVVAVDPGTVGHTWYDLTGTQGFQVPSMHSPNNVLSYGSRFLNDDVLSFVPFSLNGDDISNGLSDDPTNTLQVTAAFDSTSSSEYTQSSHFSLGSSITAEAHGSFAGFYGGVSASVSGNYASDTLRTHETVITQNTELQVTLGHIDGSLLVGGVGVGNATYVVTPYAYWSRHGALVLDYEVDAGFTPADTDGHWWDATYGVATDLSFNLPMQHDHEKGLLSTSFAALEKTRDIAIDPPVGMSGSDVTVQAVVRNHSLVDYNPAFDPQVMVSFYLEDPRAAGSTAIASLPLGFIAARDFSIVEVTWTVPYGIQPVGANGSSRIYVEIDDAGALLELREANNIAWAPVELVSPPECSDGIDNDGDGLVDAGADAGCLGSSIKQSEQDASLACDDGIDNDFDGRADYNTDPALSDSGCFDGAWPLEDPQCDDGIDNDGNGDVDGADPQCAGREWRDDERSNTACGLGFEGGFILPLLTGLRRRLRRRRAAMAS